MPPRTIIDCFFQNTPCFHIRITDDAVALEATFQLFKEKTDFMIVSQEGGVTERLHQHILLSSSFFSEKKQIKELILQQYPDAVGNSGHSITKAKNKTVLASYVLKEGRYLSKGFTREFIERAIILSFDQKDYKKKFRELRDSVTAGDITAEEYAVDLWLLKAKTGQPIVLHHFRSHCLSVMTNSMDEQDKRPFVKRQVAEIFDSFNRYS